MKKKFKKCPREWKVRLPLMQMEMNDKILERTKSSPFSLMFARRRGVFPGERVVDKEAICKRNKDMVEVVYPEIAKIARKESEKACKVANQRRILTDNAFRPGDLVMHEQARRSKNEMLYDGPFRVESYDQQKRAYTLERMDGTAVRGGPIAQGFLKRYRGREEDAEGEEEEQPIYEVTKVHDARSGENGQEYLVKWKGYAEKTWKSAENVEGAERVLELFWRSKENEDKVRRTNWTYGGCVRGE